MNAGMLIPACLDDCRLINTSVYVSTTSAVGSGSVCAANLTATTKGQLVNATCPALTGARFISIRKAGSDVLGLAEVNLYSASGTVWH